MPRKPINWANTIIYVIRSLADPTLLYVGSTTDWVKRKSNHKQNCKSSQIKLYVMIRDNGGWDNFVMTEHSKFPCENRRDAEKEEEKIRLQLQANLNTNRAFATPEQRKEDNKEYRIENKEEIKENNKKHYELHNEEILEKQKKKITCECGCIVAKGDISRHRKCQTHINLIKLNKGEILEEKKGKITCECGCITDKSHISVHRKSQKHINLLKNK